MMDVVIDFQPIQLQMVGAFIIPFIQLLLLVLNQILINAFHVAICINAESMHQVGYELEAVA